MAKIIGIINQKGGVGKTTTAVNLSAFLAKHSRRVLIVDTDSQGNATSGLPALRPGHLRCHDGKCSGGGSHC